MKRTKPDGPRATLPLVRCAVYTRKSTEEETDEPRRGGIDELSDGDGPRSDRGTNPLPETYWADYPGGKP